MPFIPHTDADVAEMLATLGAARIEDLFDEIPSRLKTSRLDGVPPALNEMGAARLMRARAALDRGALCFLGAGAYEHHIPAAVWQIAARGEFYSAYTPYQAEASQGTLQVIYEYQSMMTALTGLDVSNASLYDGASALAEAALMAVRANRRSQSRTILVPRTVHPVYTRVAETIAGGQNLRFVPLPYHRERGVTELDSLREWERRDVAAVVIPQPNFFGMLEDVDALSDWAAAQGALSIALVNPLSLAVLKPPGEWGARGTDLACGEGQPLGVPLSGGGPYFGFLTARREHLRQLPGRLVGRTTDADGRTGYTLTLQPREQHIRRSKATSNICTNQGLMVTAATIYMSLLGAEGLAQTARACHANTRRLAELAAAIPGVSRAFDGAFFHEVVLELERPVEPVLARLTRRGILGGVALGQYDREPANALLLCATETKTEDDLRLFAEALSEVLEDEAQGGGA